MTRRYRGSPPPLGVMAVMVVVCMLAYTVVMAAALPTTKNVFYNYGTTPELQSIPGNEDSVPLSDVLDYLELETLDAQDPRIGQPGGLTLTSHSGADLTFNRQHNEGLITVNGAPVDGFTTLDDGTEVYTLERFLSDNKHRLDQAFRFLSNQLSSSASTTSLTRIPVQDISDPRSSSSRGIKSSGSKFSSLGSQASDTTPHSSHPTTFQPTTFQPTTFQPTTFHPNTYQPTTYEATTYHPIMVSHPSTTVQSTSQTFNTPKSPIISKSPIVSHSFSTSTSHTSTSSQSPSHSLRMSTSTSTSSPPPSHTGITGTSLTPDSALQNSTSYMTSETPSASPNQPPAPIAGFLSESLPTPTTPIAEYGTDYYDYYLYDDALPTDTLTDYKVDAESSPPPISPNTETVTSNTETVTLVSEQSLPINPAAVDGHSSTDGFEKLAELKEPQQDLSGASERRGKSLISFGDFSNVVKAADSGKQQHAATKPEAPLEKDILTTFTSMSQDNSTESSSNLADKIESTHATSLQMADTDIDLKSPQNIGEDFQSTNITVEATTDEVKKPMTDEVQTPNQETGTADLYFDDAHVTENNDTVTDTEAIEISSVPVASAPASDTDYVPFSISPIFDIITSVINGGTPEPEVVPIIAITEAPLEPRIVESVDVPAMDPIPQVIIDPVVAEVDPNAEIEELVASQNTNLEVEEPILSQNIPEVITLEIEAPIVETQEPETEASQSTFNRGHLPSQKGQKPVTQTDEPTFSGGESTSNFRRRRPLFERRPSPLATRRQPPHWRRQPAPVAFRRRQPIAQSPPTQEQAIELEEVQTTTLFEPVTDSLGTVIETEEPQEQVQPIAFFEPITDSLGTVIETEEPIIEILEPVEVIDQGDLADQPITEVIQPTSETFHPKPVSVIAEQIPEAVRPITETVHTVTEASKTAEILQPVAQTIRPTPEALQPIAEIAFVEEPAFDMESAGPISQFEVLPPIAETSTFNLESQTPELEVPVPTHDLEVSTHDLEATVPFEREVPMVELDVPTFEVEVPSFNSDVTPFESRVPTPELIDLFPDLVEPIYTEIVPPSSKSFVPVTESVSSMSDSIGLSEFEVPTADFNMPTTDFEVTAADVEVPTSETEVPMAEFEVPIVEVEVPISTFETPTSDFEVPTATFKVPIAEIEVPTATFEVPTATFEVPMTPFEMPIAEIDVPLTEFEVPMAEFEVSTADFEVPKAEFDSPAAEFDVPEAEFEVPAAEFDVPAAEIEVSTAEFEVPTAEFEVPTAEFEVPTAEFEVPTAEFEVPTAEVEVPTAEFEVPTAEFEVPTGEFVVSTGEPAVPVLEPVSLRLAHEEDTPTFETTPVVEEEFPLLQEQERFSHSIPLSQSSSPLTTSESVPVLVSDSHSDFDPVLPTSEDSDILGQESTLQETIIPEYKNLDPSAASSPSFPIIPPIPLAVQNTGISLLSLWRYALVFQGPIAAPSHIKIVRTILSPEHLVMMNLVPHNAPHPLYHDGPRNVALRNHFLLDHLVLEEVNIDDPRMTQPQGLRVANMAGHVLTFKKDQLTGDVTVNGLPIMYRESLIDGTQVYTVGDLLHDHRANIDQAFLRMVRRNRRRFRSGPKVISIDSLGPIVAGALPTKPILPLAGSPVVSPDPQIHTLSPISRIKLLPTKVESPKLIPIKVESPTVKSEIRVPLARNVDAPTFKLDINTPVDLTTDDPVSTTDGGQVPSVRVLMPDEEIPQIDTTNGEDLIAQESIAELSVPDIQLVSEHRVLEYQESIPEIQDSIIELPEIQESIIELPEYQDLTTEMRVPEIPTLVNVTDSSSLLRFWRVALKLQEPSDTPIEETAPKTILSPHYFAVLNLVPQEYSDLHPLLSPNPLFDTIRSEFLRDYLIQDAVDIADPRMFSSEGLTVTNMAGHKLVFKLHDDGEVSVNGVHLERAHTLSDGTQVYTLAWFLFGHFERLNSVFKMILTQHQDNSTSTMDLVPSQPSPWSTTNGTKDVWVLPTVPQVPTSVLEREASTFLNLWHHALRNQGAPHLLRMQEEPKTILSPSYRAVMNLVPQDVRHPLYHHSPATVALRTEVLLDYMTVDSVKPSDTRIRQPEGLTVTNMAGHQLVFKTKDTGGITVNGVKVTKIVRLRDGTMSYTLDDFLFSHRTRVDEAATKLMLHNHPSHSSTSTHEVK